MTRNRFSNGTVYLSAQTLWKVLCLLDHFAILVECYSGVLAVAQMDQGQKKEIAKEPKVRVKYH